MRRGVKRRRIRRGKVEEKDGMEEEEAPIRPDMSPVYSWPSRTAKDSGPFSWFSNSRSTRFNFSFG